MNSLTEQTATIPTETSIPYGFCWCDCGNKTPLSVAKKNDHGFSEGEPVHFIPGHNMKRLHALKSPIVYADGKSKYVVDGFTGCWNWVAGLNESGYGVTSVKGEKTLSHVASYRLHVGPIPSGKQLDHLCRNRKCCNPYHVEPVTAKVNNNRSLSTKLTDDQVEAIRLRWRHGRVLQAALADEYGVHKSLVSRIVNGHHRTAAFPCATGTCESRLGVA